MREILFRGKTEQGEWVFGSCVMAGTEKAWILKSPCTLSMAGRELKTDFDVVKVIPSTIGQYTGLIDKNGTKIFEGDKVITGTEETFAIKYWPGWTAYALVDESCYGCFVGLLSEWGDIEVIGNIHESEVQDVSV